MQDSLPQVGCSSAYLAACLISSTIAVLTVCVFTNTTIPPPPFFWKHAQANLPYFMCIAKGKHMHGILCNKVSGCICYVVVTLLYLHLPCCTCGECSLCEAFVPEFFVLRGLLPHEASFFPLFYRCLYIWLLSCNHCVEIRVLWLCYQSFACMQSSSGYYILHLELNPLGVTFW